MSNLGQLVDAVLREPFAAARAHAQRGGRVIGYVGAEIPVELIIAGNAFPLRLPSVVQSGIGAADSHLESSFMPEARSICEQYLQGAFEFLDFIILPRSNDSAQRLYYYLSELRNQGLAKGPEPLIFDLAKIPRDTSRAHSRSSLESLASQIGTRAEALPQAIGQRNRRRELFAAAAAARMRSEARCRGSVMDRIFRASDYCDAEIFDAEFAAWLAKADVPDGRPRFLLAGSAPPDERLHVAVESAGGNVVAELGDHVSRNVASPMIPVNGSLAAIADHYQASALGQRAFVDRAVEIGSLAKRGGVLGVINWLLEEEDALIWDLPAQAAALATAGVALLSLPRRRWDASDGVLEEIEYFTRKLGKS